MNKTTERAITIKEFRKQFEEFAKELGEDAEVVIANAQEECFDGVERLFSVHIISTGEKALGMIRGKVVLKP